MRRENILVICISQLTGIIIPVLRGRDFGVEDKLLGYVQRAAQSSLYGSVPGTWGRLKKLWYL